MKDLSIRNQLDGTVQDIVDGSVVSEIVVQTKAGTLASVITTRSVKDMNLKKGDRVFLMVKATEASIQKTTGLKCPLAGVQTRECPPLNLPKVQAAANGNGLDWLVALSA